MFYEIIYNVEILGLVYWKKIWVSREIWWLIVWGGIGDVYGGFKYNPIFSIWFLVEILNYWIVKIKTELFVVRLPWKCEYD